MIFLKISIFHFFQIFFKFFFFWSPLCQVLTSIKSIDTKFLPANTIFVKNPSGKCIQIKIWAYGTSFIFNLKSLNLPISCRPQKSNFPWHRITLRVGMETILLYESLYSWGLAGRAAAQKFFEITLFYWFLLIFSVKKLKKSKSSKISILSFFPQFLPTFVRIFNLEKIYRPTIPSGWDIFRTELYPKMNSDLNLNVWTII